MSMLCISVSRCHANEDCVLISNGVMLCLLNAITLSSLRGAVYACSRSNPSSIDRCPGI